MKALLVDAIPYLVFLGALFWLIWHARRELSGRNPCRGCSTAATCPHRAAMTAGTITACPSADDSRHI